MILKFKPIFFNKVWGGNKLSSLYDLKETGIGECWGISGHKSNSNIVLNEAFKNKTLRDLYNKRRDLFGNFPSDEFPILVKYIDAKKDLSIQVHPDDQYAKLHEDSFGKEECWYILDTRRDNDIIIGNHAESKEELVKAIDTNNIQDIVNTHSINKEDFFFIPANTLHAIKANTFLLEVSQSSDISYRVYDYNRLDKGSLRELHTEQAIDVIKAPDNELFRTNLSESFTFEVKNNFGCMNKKAHKYGDYISVLFGEGYIGNYHVFPGDFFMVSSESNYKIKGKFTYHITTLKQNRC